MNKFTRGNIDDKDIVREYVKSINGILRLTGKELDLFVELVNFDREYHNPNASSKNIANAENRKYLMIKVGFTKDNLSTYIKRLTKKGLLVSSGRNNLIVNPMIMPDIVKDTVQVVIVLKLKSNVETSSSKNSQGNI